MVDKLTKLSQAIRLGSTFRPECRFHYCDPVTHDTCALAAGHEATFGIEKTIESAPKLVECKTAGHLAAQLLVDLSVHYGVPMDTLVTLNAKHYDGTLTRFECADYLEAKGY